jgi:hypothetical protein
VIKLFCYLAAITCLTGCIAMPSKQLDWQESPASASPAAVLRCWPSLQIISIDGRKKDLPVGDGLWFQKCDIQIDPGPHTLIVRHYSAGGGQIAITTSTGEMQVAFDAEPGGIYQLVGQAVRTNGAWLSNEYRVHVRKESK